MKLWHKEKESSLCDGTYWPRHGWWNEGKNVKNVGITFNRDSKDNLIFHATIDEYTLFYCVQVIIYALKGIYSFIYYSENEIEEQIRMYHSTRF